MFYILEHSLKKLEVFKNCPDVLQVAQFQDFLALYDASSQVLPGLQNCINKTINLTIATAVKVLDYFNKNG